MSIYLYLPLMSASYRILDWVLNYLTTYIALSFELKIVTLLSSLQLSLFSISVLIVQVVVSVHY